MIELTHDQRDELCQPEPMVLDPQTRQLYVLVRKEVYDRLKGLMLDETTYLTAETLDSVMREDDAGDLYLDELQKKYGGRTA